jgi:enediyne biosynthesis protein E4
MNFKRAKMAPKMACRCHNNKSLKEEGLMRSQSFRLKLISFFLIGTIALFAGLQAGDESKKEKTSINNIIGEIQKLESNRDPKCHATATRLENFMYGTKLSNDARFLKVELQKKLLLQVWEQVTHKVKTLKADTQGNRSQSLAKVFKDEIQRFFQYTRKSNGDITVTRKDKTPLILEKRDIQHYSSVAYALRTVLAVQQDMMFRTDIKPVTLDADVIATLKELLDIFTLSVLQVSDKDARRTNCYELTPELFQKAWDEIRKESSPKGAPVDAQFTWGKVIPTGNTATGQAKFATLMRIIDQKVKSYEAYNKISMQVFLRNLQVYFARHRWPKDKEEGNAFRNLFTESMISFSAESMQLAQQVAIKKQHRLIREADVDEMWKSFVPFDVNAYEDIIFFPNLGREGSLTIESYDFDAFRDSGIHWRYLQFALQDHGAKMSIEPDPFASELLVEGIAQFGVLVLRIAGDTAKKKGDKQLKMAHLREALAEIRRRVSLHAKAKPIQKNNKNLASSGGTTRVAAGKTYFDDVTQVAGIAFMHRSSDWLSRLLRSYLQKSANVGTLNVPPAFGGSGAAAGDINGDGIDDLLLLSGAGNKLYKGKGNGTFIDITKEAGIMFLGEDGHPGEPRQPIIADFDNDGRQDILITYVKHPHKLYRNIGNGTFKDVSISAKLGGQDLVGGPALAFDYDRDGLLDIYILYFGNYLKGKLPTLNRRNLNGLPNRLFRNKGNMVFEDVTEKSGVDNTGWGQAAAHTDLDLDGWQDIIVGNDFGVNVYYRNRGDGTFENIAAKLNTDKPSFTMNVGITDLNRDSYPDIYISNIVTMVKDEKYVLPGKETTMKFNPEKMGRMRVIEANDLFLSDTKGGKFNGFTLSDAVGRGFSSTGWAWGANFFDFDNDGDDDLYCVNGMNEYSVYSDTPYYTSVFNEKKEVKLLVYAKESNVFFVNQGGKLQNQSKQSGTDLLGNSRSTVYFDIDNDGDLDILLNNYHGAAVVYRNNSQQMGNNWLKVKLVGDPAQKCNLDAIGARVVAFKNDRQVAWRELRGGDGYLCMNPKTQHMGLGKEQHVDLKVFWPNGKVSNFKDVSANKKYQISLKSNKIVSL